MAVILILIAFPSFKLLYLMDEVNDASMTILIEGHQWYWIAPFNYKIRCEKITFPVDMGSKGTDLTEVEKLGEWSMFVKALWGEFFSENECRPMIVMVWQYMLLWVSIALYRNTNNSIYLTISTKVQLVIISTIKRSLQLVGHNIKPKTISSVSYRNSGFPKGCKSYLWNSKTRGWNIIGNGGSVVVIHEGNQSRDFGLLPAGRKFYTHDTKSKVNSEIVQNIEVSYKQLFSVDI